MFGTFRVSSSDLRELLLDLGQRQVDQLGDARDLDARERLDDLREVRLEQLVVEQPQVVLRHRPADARDRVTRRCHAARGRGQPRGQPPGTVSMHAISRVAAADTSMYGATRVGDACARPHTHTRGRRGARRAAGLHRRM